MCVCVCVSVRACVHACAELSCQEVVHVKAFYNIHMSLFGEMTSLMEPS